ncbi:Wall-associated receptor kinase [Parasponia andersonii]|uniref:Wall-associated receptor kinase n=1 Tax=Parasponia andersonii TaxID=3476 RepID=A0A2P5A7Z0_PARAD|nr:Wall-associated receptor kinase [Parasponia andersonii]
MEMQKYHFLCLVLLSSWPWISKSPWQTAATAATATTTPTSNSDVIVKSPSCHETCGDVKVPYPFGIDDPNCAKDEGFFLKCNRTVLDSSPKLILGKNLEVLNIDVENATMSVVIFNAYECYNKDGFVDKREVNITLGATSPYTFSASENKLVAFGCDTLAFMSDADKKFGSGCVALCSSNIDMSEEGSCSGFGCCQTSVPKNLKTLLIQLSSPSNHRDVLSFNPCGFAFLVDQRSFNISKMRLDFWPRQVQNSSVLLDWVVGNEICDKAQSNSSSYVCGDNTHCYYSENGLGYRCRCLEGFRGNPYLKQGCQDIDECKNPETYRCQGKCKNTIGGYICKCPLGMHGDGKESCQGFRVTAIASVIGASIFVVIIALLLFHEYRRRKREKIFKQNGGLVLKHQRVRIFSKAELAKATNNYNQSSLLGQGGFASVHKGVLFLTGETSTTTQQIAVKKPKLDASDKNKNIQINHQQFHEEIAIVSQVNHKNVVKLLGLCLETKIPILVYELVPNGTLSQHIHGKRSDMLRPWKTRLRIATETALAIDYLHSLAHPPIIHRDIKSTNILLDENYTAKVSDFGASVLIPPGQTGIATTILGTFGYLDPEYLTTGTLTAKSDVYSFGVVLVELITGEKPISNGARNGAKRNMIQYFVSTVRENEGEKYVKKIVDSNVVYNEDHESEIEAVAELATRCLNGNGVKRPSMKDVAEELAGLNRLKRKNNYKARQDGEETEQLLEVDQKLSFSVGHESVHNPVEYTTFDVSGFEIESSSISIN